jgi:S2P endopeptidase
MLSSGLSLLLILPSAFVSLSSASLSQLLPHARMRIIAAGPYHNFVFWVLIFGLGWTGVERWLAMVGYMDVTVLGKGVVAFDKACLYGITFYGQNVMLF